MNGSYICQQITDDTILVNNENSEDIPFCRQITQDSPLASYVSSPKPNHHDGQRKLFVGELEFLTKYGDKSNIIVYAGAASGTHIYLLALLFPTHQFLLWDPGNFRVRSHPNIHINPVEYSDSKYPGFFTTVVAKRVIDKFGPNRVLFISDIRTCGAKPSADELYPVGDEDIISNMSDQAHWIKIMKPIMASVKFRLPWNDNKTWYLGGDLFFQAWAPPNSTECRLITNGETERWYSNRWHERVMSRFNRWTRTGYYSHEISIRGVDHCYDCKTEIETIRAYLLITSQITEPGMIVQTMNLLSIILSRGLDEGFHGKFVDIIDSQKRRALLLPLAIEADPKRKKQREYKHNASVRLKPKYQDYYQSKK